MGLAGFILMLLSIIGFIVPFIKTEQRMADGYVNVPIANVPKKYPFIGLIIGIFLLMFNGIFFYAQPGYQYHVKTITGQELHVDKMGYSLKLFGDVEPWKNGTTIMAKKTKDGEPSISYAIQPEMITFLDQVDAMTTASVRIQMPHDSQSFFKIVRDFRTQENFLRTSVVPAFRITLDATGSMMTAEDYYSGGKTGFQDLFLEQMTHGIYIVKRIEKVIVVDVETEISANASDDEDTETQKETVERTKTIFSVEKLVDADGVPRRKIHNFLSFGVTVNDAMITSCRPNKKFLERMGLKQKASADRAIAKEQRIQEEEQRLLAIAIGDREVAQREAVWKADQMEQTTKAETAKQLVLTKANQEKERALISKQTAQTLLDKAGIDAKAVKVTADAEAHARRVKIEADNALKMKLDAIIAMNRDNAEALAVRNVPTTVIYAGDAGKDGMGTDQNVANILNTQLIKNMKALDLDMGVKGLQTVQ